MTAGDKDQEFAPINVDVDDRIPTSSARKPTQTVVQPVKSNNILVSTLLLVSLVALAGCVYLYLELQKANQTIVSNGDRILSVENQLSATGEEIGNSTVALQVKVSELTEKSKELWDQMDKLWASAWRRNQQEIKALQTSVKDFQTDVNKVVGDVNKRVDNAESDNQQLVTRINSINGNISEQANNLLAVTVEQENLNKQDADKSKEIRELNEKIILLERRNTNLLQKLNELESQLKEVINKTV
ncbi:hypothetical protein [Agaribacter marinus]|uniref:Uncharacterized protein n=1 Tax=Agaribacter marinus TaxID=1431249 RepID=A0AA37WIT8_9ALTE|nr:hypothetical protein [Agaribacter marinus]GLR69799.1 hypothetical protein GCM10007852_07070 [Agaribacter marinus]